MGMTILSSTTPHYVRCIKPNESKAAFGYDFKQVLTQLSYLGVLEVVRIRQQGFPMRIPYVTFLSRFHELLMFSQLPVVQQRLPVEARPKPRSSLLRALMPRRGGDTASPP